AKMLEVVSYLTQQAGLLSQTDEKIYRLHHRTFQELLAASHLARLSEFRKIRDHIQEKPYVWREPFLLLGDVLTGDQLWGLIQNLTFYDLQSSSQSNHWYSIWLAGKVVENRQLYKLEDRDKR